MHKKWLETTVSSHLRQLRNQTMKYRIRGMQSPVVPAFHSRQQSLPFFLRMIPPEIGNTIEKFGGGPYG